MTISELRSAPLSIPFTQAFRHAAAERAETSSLWVEVRSTTGALGVGESCPRPYVTGETLESAQAFLAFYRASICEEIYDPDSLRDWIGRHAAEVDEHPAAWCAVELALWDVLGKETGRTVESLLGVAPLAGRFSYSAVLGDMALDAFEAGVARYLDAGFIDFKVKLSGDGDRDRQKIDRLRGASVELRVRVDANNLWRAPREAIDGLRVLGSPIFAIEEPIPPNQYHDLVHMAEALGVRIVLDESALRVSHVIALPGPRETWLVNVRVSKMGGLVRSLAVVEASRAAGIQVIVGAQVGETSVLTRAGLTVAHAARDLLVAQEGAFGTQLLARDVCDPPLMFGRAGVLDVARFPALAEPGLGLELLPGY